MPSYTTQNVGYSRVFADSVLAAFKADPGAALIVTGKVRLSRDPDFNPAFDTPVADLTPNEADFTGYPAGGVAVTMSDPLNILTTAQAILISALFIVTEDDPQVENQVYGWWIDNGTDVIAYERFNTSGPFNLAEPGDYLDCTILLPMRLAQAAA